MIKRVHIMSLKSIKDMTVECAKLNLLTGTNSSGKSTFIQALLMLEQCDLNGRYVSIGEFREAKNYNAPSAAISIEAWLDNEEEPVQVLFEEERGGGHGDYNVILRNGVKAILDRGIPQLPQLHYLSCQRIGVSDVYLKGMAGQDEFGINGEYALSFLLKNADMPVRDSLIAPDQSITNSLLDQVNYWLRYIVGTTVSVSDIQKTNHLQVKYNNNPKNASSESMYCRPSNLGSGISYLISIVILCLGAEEGSILIIENPEIHLHPKAQSRLSDFLYFTSRAGVQLFVETHSDHIFNGLRVGVAEGKIRQEDLGINFLALNELYETQCNPIIFKEFGKVVGTNDSMDIRDLFDQFDIDLERMLGI